MPKRCFVLFCNSSSCSSRHNRKISLFQPPKDEALFQQWVKIIPGFDRPFQRSDFVCDRHFEDHFIEKEYTHIINGEEIKIKRDRAKLKSGAIPTLFPRVPSERKHRKSSKNAAVTKKQSTDLSTEVVNTSSTLNRVWSLPSNLCFKQSKTPGEGYEVWSTEDIAIGTRFGPYEGVCVDQSKSKTGGYQWLVARKGKGLIILDGEDLKESNWLRYVNYATTKEEQNLIAVQCQSEVSYITCKPIPRNTELLVWYQHNFAKYRKEPNGYDLLYLEKASFSLSKSVIPKKPHKSNISENTITSPFVLTQQEVLYSAEEPYICSVCGNKFETIPELKIHRRIHFDEMLYECKKCDRKFTWKNELKLHKRIHIGQKTYKCNICGKGFVHDQALTTHLILHTSEKYCECHTHETTSMCKNILKQHDNLHTRKKLYECEICGKTFSWKPTFMVHMRLHAGEKPYLCKACGKSFAQRRTLNRHAKLHTGEKPYKCKTCGKSFTRRNIMKEHKRLHTGEKPYKCSVCGKAFIRPSSVITHTKFHTGEKPFECNVCGKAFVRQIGLLTHEKVHSSLAENKWTHNYDMH